MSASDRYDLLVNHASDDDVTAWVSELVTDLSNQLAHKLKRACRIKMLSGPEGAALSEDARALLQQTELMVVVVSESYRAQNQQEVAAFVEAHEDDGRIRSRFFVLECGVAPRDRLHWQLCDRRGYRFWISDLENSENSIRRLQNNDDDDTERYYSRELDRLAEDLARALMLLEAEPPPSVSVREEGFDVFLCHNSEDKPEVRRVGEALKARGLRPWLDEWELPIGQPWIRRLEQQIETVGSAAVFLGPNGTGPWQQREIDAILQELDDKHRPIIPVILGEPDKIPKLPLFLRGINWVKWHDDPISLDQLVSGITGKKQLPAVYLAETSDDLFRLRIAVAQHLRQYELRVLPDDFVYPEAPEKFEAAVERDLAQCRLFVQLLGDRPGPSLSAFPPNFAQRQFDLALAQEMTILQWRSPSLDLKNVEDKGHQALLAGDYVREVSIDEFKRHVRKEAKTPPIRRGRRAFVHFAPDDADENLLDEVLEELERNDIQYEPTELDHLKTLVKGGKHLLVFYGNADMRRQLRVGLKECRPLIANRTTVLGVYTGPPPEIPKLRVNYDGLFSIDGQQGLNREGLGDFIKAVKERVTSA